MNSIAKMIFILFIGLTPMLQAEESKQVLSSSQVEDILFGAGYTPEEHYLYISKDKKRAYFGGHITNSSSEFIKAMPSSIEILRIESRGGSVIGANKVAEEVYRRKIATFSGIYCYSVCTLIFQAGHERQASKSTVFMYQQPALFTEKQARSYEERLPGFKKAYENYKKEIEQFYTFYKKYGLGSSFTENIKTSIEKFYFSGFDEVPMAPLQPMEDKNSAEEATSVELTVYDDSLKDMGVLHNFYPQFNDITQEMIEDMRRREPEITANYSDSRVKETFVYSGRVSQMNREEWSTSKDFHRCYLRKVQQYKEIDETGRETVKEVTLPTADMVIEFCLTPDEKKIEFLKSKAEGQ